MKYLIRKLYLIIDEIKSIISLIIIHYPGKYGYKLRNYYWSKKIPLILTRKNVIIGKGCIFEGNISIGENFSASNNVTIDACDSHGIFIGNNALIAQGVYFRSANHCFDSIDKPINTQGHTFKILNHSDGNAYSIII